MATSFSQVSYCSTNGNGVSRYGVSGGDRSVGARPICSIVSQIEIEDVASKLILSQPVTSYLLGTGTLHALGGKVYCSVLHSM